MADEVSKLGIRVGSLEREHENIKRRATQSAHDLSEHLHRDESTNDAIKAHMAKFEAALGALTTTNTDQSKRLVRIDRLHPWIMIVAGAIGAAVSGYVHEAVHPPTTTVVPGDAPR